MKKNVKFFMGLATITFLSLSFGCIQSHNEATDSTQVCETDSIAPIAMIINDTVPSNPVEIADTIPSNPVEITDTIPPNPVEIVDTCDLRIYYPNYSKIDLVCGTMPSKDDRSVIMFAEAAFTGKLLKKFNHNNIASSHVSNGTYNSGYLCERNRGVFTYYNGEPHFVYEGGFQKVAWPKYMETALREAARNNGCGFAQEMMLHEGKIIKHTRPDDNSNEFRALCLIKGKVAIADSKGVMSFGDFIDNLQKVGATEAIYLDMGAGWNYSWYRDADGNPVEIHSSPTKYATNWITFYK